MIDNIIKSFIEQKEKLTKELRGWLIMEVSDFFQKYPALQSIGFTAYTPYFNDGDTCYYSLNIWDFEINGEWTWEKRSDLQDQYPTLRDDFSSILNKVDCAGEEILKTIFGDHVKVTFVRDENTIKMKTEYWDHD